MAARVGLIRRPGDHPRPAEHEAEAAFFTALFPGKSEPEIDDNHLALAALAQNPALAQMAARMSGFLLLETGWGQRAMVRELVLQVVNRSLGCDYGAETRLTAARAAGLSDERLAALARGDDSPFDDEQRLIIAYARACLSGPVPTELFAQIVGRYGEQQAVECTAVIGFWTFWAIVTNATLPGG
jgi:alkylhydroperoxidase family enzyme